MFIQSYFIFGKNTIQQNKKGRIRYTNLILYVYELLALLVHRYLRLL